MAIWYEGSSEIECNIQKVKHAVDNIGEHFVEIVGLMPGITSVEPVEHGNDFTTLRTNEGLMKRTNIHKRVKPESVVVEFDEEYKAGSKITTKTHFLHEFMTRDTRVEHRIVLSDVKASGFLGFFYRLLGSNATGNAFLKSYKTYLESKTA